MTKVRKSEGRTGPMNGAYSESVVSMEAQNLCEWPTKDWSILGLMPQEKVHDSHFLDG